MKNLMKSFRELSYFELLGMNGGYGGGSGGGSGSKSGGSGYSGGSGGSSSGGSSSNRKNSSGRKPGYTRYIGSDATTKTTGTINLDGSETVTKVNTETGEIIYSYTNRTAIGSSYSSSSSGTLSSGSSKSDSNSKGYSSSSGSYTVSYGHSSSGRGSYSGSSSGWGRTYTTSYETSSGGSGTSGVSSKQEKNKYDYQTCSNKDNVHCDIIAWNHAVDAGLNPAGNGNNNWDGNKLTVDEIYNKHYADEAVEFNSDLAGKKGYIFYDWEGDGKFDHIEYCEVDANGAGYSFYNNDGHEKSEEYYHRYFIEDNNAGAENGGLGKLKFVALN